MNHHEMIKPDSTPLTRTARLRAQTNVLHKKLDQRLQSERPFESLERYRLYLLVQAEFHNALAPIYADKRLNALIPGLAACARANAVRQDMLDLGLTPLALDPHASTKPISDALGWLYVCEGSTLGAAFLLKFAAALGLTEKFGARHLGAAPEGRAEHWRRFSAALDAVELPEAAETRAEFGANAAFCFVYELVEQHFAPDAPF